MLYCEGHLSLFILYRVLELTKVEGGTKYDIKQSVQKILLNLGVWLSRSVNLYSILAALLAEETEKKKNQLHL